MTESLRERCIEKLWFYCGGDAPDALDAVLSVLSDHADEWIREAVVNDWDDQEAYESMVRAMSGRERRLLAVLRGNGE